MDMSFKLYILSSNGPEVYAVNIYKDDKNKDGYVILGNTNVSLHIFEVLHLRDHVCSIKGVGDSDKNNLKLWKVIGVKSKDIKEQNISTEKDIVQKLRGKEMELEGPFSTYFQDELDNKNKSGSSIITIITATDQPIKKRKIEEDRESYTTSNGQSVELPSRIIEMLNIDKFVPDPRINFINAFQGLHVGQSITLPNLGQEPKHFAKGYQGRTLLVTKQMIDIWDELLTDSEHSIKRILSGPMGVGKSYISHFLASKAYAESWIILYIADASDLCVRSPIGVAKVICDYFFALNKDILTTTDLKQIAQFVEFPYDSVEVLVADAIFRLLKTSGRKTLLVVDEHGALFETDPPVPVRLHFLNPLMTLNFWGEHYKFARVIFTGTAHAKYEREHVKNGHKQECMIFVGPLQDDVFDELLQLHSVLSIPEIKKEVKKVTNCVPREVMHMVKHIDGLNFTITNVICFREALKKFESNRVDEILLLAQKYYNDLQKTEKKRYYESLTSMFLPSRPTVQFDWKFLDLGLIYRYKEAEIIHYFPLCPSAQKALLKMYMSFELPENIKNQFRMGELDGIQFEEALFSQLICRCGTTIQFNTTDLNNINRNKITLQFDDYGLIKSSQLSLGPGNERVLGRGFDGYPRFDFVLGPIFIQISISDFQNHNKKSKDIRKAFERPMSKLSNIDTVQINGRNQIEMYLDEMYGPGHSAEIQNHRFVVTRNGTPVAGFRIVYIHGKSFTPNHSGKVKEFPDVMYVSLEELKIHLFPNIA